MCHNIADKKSTATTIQGNIIDEVKVRVRTCIVQKCVTVCTCTCTCVCTHLCTCMCVHVCENTCVCMHVHLRVCACIHVHLRVCVCVCVSVDVHYNIQVGMKLLWNSRSQKFIGHSMTHDELASLCDVYAVLQPEYRKRQTTYVLQTLWRNLTSDFDVIGPHYTNDSPFSHHSLCRLLLDSIHQSVDLKLMPLLWSIS